MNEQLEKNRLLWIDDDPRERFVFEEHVLTEHDNWDITWAPTVLDAMKSLSQKTFHAIVLDQMLPIESMQMAPEIWGGCYLLHWLRNGRAINNRYLHNRLKGSDPIHKKYMPIEKNKRMRLFILSASHDEDVLKETRKASEFDVDLQFHSKPVEADTLRERLKNFLK